MKKIILKIGDVLFTPTYAVLICYFLYNDELRALPYINAIRLIVIALPVFLCICAIIEPANKFKVNIHSKSLSNKKNIIEVLYFYSEYIINYSFYLYFFIYMILELEHNSVSYSYLLLLIFGAFWGYGIAKKGSSFKNKSKVKKAN